MSNNSVFVLNFKCRFVIVKVKWGKETYPDIEVNTDESPILFKAQLFALTGVQPERQKVMLKGVTLKDEEWKNFNLKDVNLPYIVLRKIHYSLLF